jgi:hypothetical protein
VEYDDVELLIILLIFILDFEKHKGFKRGIRQMHKRERGLIEEWRFLD